MKTIKFLCALFLLAGSAWAESVRLQWDAPVINDSRIKVTSFAVFVNEYDASHNIIKSTTENTGSISLNYVVTRDPALYGFLVTYYYTFDGTPMGVLGERSNALDYTIQKGETAAPPPGAPQTKAPPTSFRITNTRLRSGKSEAPAYAPTNLRPVK